MTITHKCDSTERQINEMMFLNAALKSQIEETKMKIGIAKAERKYLLTKLLYYEKKSAGECISNHGNSNGADIVSPLSISTSTTSGTSGILQQALSRQQLASKKPINPSQLLQPSSTPINP